MTESIQRDTLFHNSSSKLKSKVLYPTNEVLYKIYIYVILKSSRTPLSKKIFRSFPHNKDRKFQLNIHIVFSLHQSFIPRALKQLSVRGNPILLRDHAPLTPTSTVVCALFLSLLWQQNKHIKMNSAEH